MKREIKFRVWDEFVPKDLSEAVYNKPTGMMINWDYVKESSYLLDGIKGIFPIMQYTGLKDKKGKEIYEGDILRQEETFPESSDAEVVFFEGAFRVKDLGGDIQELLCDVYKDSVIIGNIYENPNL